MHEMSRYYNGAVHEILNAKVVQKQQALSILSYKSYFTNLFISFSIY
jgi:hypothetical protein